MVTVIVVIRRKPGMSREEFLRHWRDDHPAYVRRLPGIRGYRQSPAIDHRKAWPFDGMAELQFDSVGAVARAFESPAARELFAHEEAFLGGLDWFIADERVDVPLDVSARSSLEAGV
ncbi:EthD family reductase [Microbacterium schleiferi]|uniref:EthD family reductase n=1 Tax=Microbacterium schleiferi TaxID=69362 RepID=UPI00311EC97A